MFKHRHSSFCFLGASLVALLGVACAKSSSQPASSEPAKVAVATPAAPQAQNPHDLFANLAVVEVSTLIAEKKVTAVDANGADTRSELGCVPGSVRLSSYDEFAASELPGDKNAPLVFYCGGEKCMAAPNAAARAKAAGYTHVSVMRAGIRGWVDAGHPVDKCST